MLTKNPLRHLQVILLFLSLTCIGLAPTDGFAKATLKIVKGSGEFMTLEQAITVSAPELITFQWSTDQASATGGTWKVTKPNGMNAPQVMASGESSPAPKVGHVAMFTIPASGAGSFLQSPAPSVAVKYTITITPHGATKQPLGSSSPAVAVTQVPQSTQPPIHFNPPAVFPSIELIHYEEKIGQVPQTQIFYANATVTLRAVNNGNATTDRSNVEVTDSNVLMRQTGVGASIGPLKKGEKSEPITLELSAILPPPESQMGQQQQIAKWKAQYNNLCGVDLGASLSWVGEPGAPIPMGMHENQDLYLGYGNSKSWDENHPMSNATICDSKQCVSLNAVSRSIYKQIACRVVGYAFYVGDRTSGPRGVFGAFGKARTSLDPPETDFAPTTKMQIASTSKVLTALTGMRVFGSKLNNVAFQNFPSNWTLPQNTIVKNITFRQFLSQTSGVMQYYAGAQEDFSSLQTFFTQPLPTPNAPQFCPGPPPYLPAQLCSKPACLDSPIVTQKIPFCYTNTNFSIMRLLLPRFAGATTNDPMQLAQKYVQQVRDNVFTPVGVQDVACKPPASPSSYARLYKYPGNQLSADWGDLTLVCGAWGWHVSVQDYAKVLVSLNSADHKILTDCQLRDMESNPAAHPVGWDTNLDGTSGSRWLEKNGGDGSGNGAGQSASVGIFGGSNGCKVNNVGNAPVSGVAGVLFINSDISGQPGIGADTILINAFRAAVKPKP